MTARETLLWVKFMNVCVTDIALSLILHYIFLFWVFDNWPSTMYLCIFSMHDIKY